MKKVWKSHIKIIQASQILRIELAQGITLFFFFLPLDKNYSQEPSPHVDGTSSKNWSFLFYHQKNKEPQQGISLCSLVFRKPVSFVGLWYIYAVDLSRTVEYLLLAKSWILV